MTHVLEAARAVAWAWSEFPTDAVPDNHVMGPHHLYVGVFALLGVVLVVADNYAHREPLLALAGGLTALFAFMYVWPFYPEVGAAGALLGLALAGAGVLWPGGFWADVALRARVAAGVAVYVALDDVLEHAFPVPTPLDVVFNRVIYPVIA